MDTPETRVQIAAEESDQLKQYLGTLTPEAWERMTACQRWTVADMVAHLAWVAESYTSRIHQSLRGEAVPADGSTPPGAVLAVEFAEGNAQAAITRRSDLGEGVPADFIRQNDELIRMMGTLSGSDWDLPHYYASLGTVAMRYRPDLWISELAMHGWDIQSRLEPRANLSERALPTCADVVPGQLMHFLFNPQDPLARPLRYRWSLSGPGTREVDVVVFGDRVEVGASDATSADVVFNTDTETFVLASWRRLGIDAAAASGRISIDGDLELAKGYQQWFWGN